jgi:hypothetical protein
MGCALDKPKNQQPKKRQEQPQPPKERTWTQRLRDGDAPEVGGI